MKTFIMLLTIVASVALGQQKLTGEQADQAWKTVENHGLGKGARGASVSMAPLTGATLVPVPKVNGEVGTKVVLITKVSGQFLFQVNMCNGTQLPLAYSYQFDRAPEEYVIWTEIMETVSWLDTCSVTMFRIEGGVVSGTSVSFNHPQPANFSIVSEGWSPNGYYLHIAGSLRLDATVVLGTNAMATKIEKAPMGEGYFVYFPKDIYPPFGMVTVTVSQDGVVQTQGMYRNMTPVPTVSGKG